MVKLRSGVTASMLLTAVISSSALAQGNDRLKGRITRNLKNSAITVRITPGGGHIASIYLNQGRGHNVNPFWVPHWKSVEPGVWMGDPAAYGGMPAAQLLSSILGHNICVDFFGAPSKAETAAGLPVHGEAPCLTWKVNQISGSSMNYGVTLPMAQMKVSRTVTLAKSSGLVQINESVENTAGIDRPFGWQQHPSFGAPFVAKGQTFFDFGGTWSMVYPKEFSKGERLKRGEEFEWPEAPGANGDTIDLRAFPGNEAKNSDFTVTLVPPDQKHGWFTVTNTSKRLLVGYVWPRAAWPWIANWEENKFRDGKPWLNKGLARGVEFGTTPWPDPRKDMVSLGTLHETPTYRWISAKSRQTIIYYLFMTEVPAGTTGAESVTMSGKTVSIQLKGVDKTIKLSM